jgi:hypothetical protein
MREFKDSVTGNDKDELVESSTDKPETVVTTTADTQKS